MNGLSVRPTLVEVPLAGLFFCMRSDMWKSIILFGVIFCSSLVAGTIDPNASDKDFISYGKSLNILENYMVKILAIVLL